MRHPRATLTSAPPRPPSPPCAPLWETCTLLAPRNPQMARLLQPIQRTTQSMSAPQSILSTLNDYKRTALAHLGPIQPYARRRLARSSHPSERVGRTIQPHTADHRRHRRRRRPRGSVHPRRGPTFFFSSLSPPRAESRPRCPSSWFGT
jgi:hypothetical protein